MRFRGACECVRGREPALCVHVLAVCVQAPRPSRPVAWEPQDPEGGKLLPADVAKMDRIYLD